MRKPNKTPSKKFFKFVNIRFLESFPETAEILPEIQEPTKYINMPKQNKTTSKKSFKIQYHPIFWKAFLKLHKCFLIFF